MEIPVGAVRDSRADPDNWAEVLESFWCGGMCMLLIDSCFLLVFFLLFYCYTVFVCVFRFLRILMSRILSFSV